ncbi:uncharacterized protein LOC110272987 [Arachis duranensis]|uniref:Uncharacterized protein LOC110272987 n=1 Tax=Arachis duranensis TaxID=130453 RepID=A0A6P5M864_ARADU|nr:uncharacterized protein LOC110272987 [Arachis duranensis]
MEQGASVGKPSELTEDTLPPQIAPDDKVPSHEQKMELKPLLSHLNEWVSPVQVVQKKSGITTVKNEHGKLIATTVQNSWMVCIDYRRLNQATCKDHYPLPFIDQMLNRLSGHVVSNTSISVDPAKVDVISGLAYPSSVREVHSFFGHAGFYRRFIKDFSKVALVLSRVL